MKVPTLIILVLLLVLGLTSFIFVRVEAGQGSTFTAAQRSAQRLTVAGVERVVRTAPEGQGGQKGRSAKCLGLGHVGLRNPWHCLIIYRDGTQVQYTVQIRLSGAYVGTDQVIERRGVVSHGSAQITGCCVVVP